MFRPASSVVSWLLVLNGVVTLLCQGCHLGFLEPLVPRGALAFSSLAAAALALLAEGGHLPRTLADARAAIVRSHSTLLLASILGVALALRVWGITSGLPQSYPADEFDFVNRALKMIKTAEFAPHWWHHPTLHRYLSAALYAAVFLVGVSQGRWQQLNELSEVDLLYWGRFLSAVVGTLTVLALFFLARRFLGTGLALLASALLAVFPAAIENDQFNKPDSLVTLLVVVAVRAAVDYLDRPSALKALLCGATVGLAVTAKWNGGLVVVSLLIALAGVHGWRLLTSREIYLAGLGGVIALIAGSPFILKELGLVLDHIAASISTYGVVGRIGADGTDNWLTHARYLLSYGSGPVATLAALVGVAGLLYRLDAWRGALVSFPVLYYAYYSSQLVNYTANLLPVVPFVALFAAHGLAMVAKAVGSAARRRATVVGRLALAGLSLTAIVVPARDAVAWNRHVTQRDTGSYAAEWIERNIAPESKIAVEEHCPVLDPRVYAMTREPRIIQRSVDAYRADGIEYLIVTSLRYARFPADHPQTVRYSALFAETTLIKEFTNQDGRIPGPDIRILRVPPAESTGMTP